MNRTHTLIQAFRQHFGASPHLIARAPGRVNLIGEHTDYNEGFVLPMAIDRDVQVAARPRADRIVRMLSLNFDRQDEFSLDDIQRVADRVTWGDYVRGVARVLQDEGYSLRGAELAIEGNVPTGSGLSSSAAMELATLTAFRELNHLDIDPVRAALLSQRAENTFVGVKCGIMDQFISSLGQAGHALLIDCRWTIARRRCRQASALWWRTPASIAGCHRANTTRAAASVKPARASSAYTPCAM